MRLTDLPLRQPAYVDLIDWTSLPASDAQRLREFGLCEGASVEALHHGGLLGHPDGMMERQHYDTSA